MNLESPGFYPRSPVELLAFVAFTIVIEASRPCDMLSNTHWFSKEKLDNGQSPKQLVPLICLEVLEAIFDISAELIPAVEPAVASEKERTRQIIVA